MKLSIRFVLPLVFVLAILSYVTLPIVDTFTMRWFIRDLDIRSRLVTNTMEEPLSELINANSKAKILIFFKSVVQDERLFAIGFCDLNGVLQYQTDTFLKDFNCNSDLLTNATNSTVLPLEKGSIHIAAHPIDYKGKAIGRLILVHDMSFITRRGADTRKYVLYLFVALAIVISLVTVLLAHLSWRGWVSGMRTLLRGEGVLDPRSQFSRPELLPLAKDLRDLVRDLELNRTSKDESHALWTAASLKKILKEELIGEEVLIVSNREPYIHLQKNNKIEVQVPASGLVTALEPIMRACSGTWIAHGSGTADRSVVDKHDRVLVPPEEPAYAIRRVWLSKEEEAGYYYGFSNEGLWPLCHIAHTRPIFRVEDWDYYVKVNEKFAAVVLEEAKTEDPVILIQDYHLALLPRMVREKLPKATIISFWHIPWPNPEAFGICPWREEILHGLLGSSIMGFHTRFHCNNFLDTVDRFLEARIDNETSTVSYGGKLTAVKEYPISIEWPSRWSKDQKSILETRTEIRRVNNLPENILLGIGIDRMDYTKGILERFLAVEKLLEKFPEWIGRFTFIQIAAPSRSSIEQYQNFESEVRALAQKINTRYGKDGYQPIYLKVEHHTPQQVFEYYRAADICMVTSLHDGMNLVAKEFISARDDNKGVLILSQFTGASRELPEALIVNPYNIAQCANALQIALTMPDSEQKARMRSMRSLVQEFNVYRWAARMLKDAARMKERARLRGRIRESQSSHQGNFSI